MFDETDINNGWPWPPIIPPNRKIAALQHMLAILADILEEADRDYGYHR